MPNIVTAMMSLCDENGNYSLEVTGEDGKTFDVLIPPEMELHVRTIIQENELRRMTKMGFLGMMILDVTNSRTGVRKQTGETSLIVETKQFGWFGLRLDAKMARQMIGHLQNVLKPQRGTTH